jgi:integrase/recombinase XerD
MNKSKIQHLAPEIQLQYCDYCRRVKHVCNETISGDQAYLDRLFEHLKITNYEELLSRITARAISTFLSDYANKYPHGSCRRMQYVLRSFLKYGWLNKLIDRDLLAIVPTVRRRHLANIPRALSDGNIKDLLDSMGGSSPSDLRNFAIITLLVTYGVRGVQIRHLCLGDLDWEQELIHFSAAKGGRLVTQVMMPAAGNALLAYLQRGRPKTKHSEVFMSLNKPVHPLRFSSNLSSMCARYFKKAQITLPEGVSYGTHGFRHAFASRLVGLIPFKQLSDMLGHSDPASTQIYSKVNFSLQQEAALPWPQEEIS